ncbi:hypothetical protein [Blastococcus aggregatus]|uniref:hypothetical protein n=1 Tax=Blastococcus aggregatus TaxID=38502 RepID=UPI000BE22A1A|nr:hypothetical protein [Blastococcus aggregatus]
MTIPPTPVLLSAADAATYAVVRPATLRIWRHRYRMEPRWSPDEASLYSLDELAAVLARRADSSVD